MDRKNPRSLTKFLPSLRRVLTDDQYRIVETIANKPEAQLILLDAPPGTGKSFLMLQLCRRFGPRAVITIFKHDLLAPFSSVTNTITNCKFMIDFFNTQSMMTNGGIEHACTRVMSVDQYFYTLVGFTRNFQKAVPNFEYIDFLICDEYGLMMNECILAVSVTAVYNTEFNCRVIFSGDSRQLGSIHSSIYSAKSSAAQVIESFDESKYLMVELDKNQRCKDPKINSLFRLISSRVTSTDKTLDLPLATILHICMPYQTIFHPMLTDVVVATSHAQLSDYIEHQYTSSLTRPIEYRVIDREFYMIDPQTCVNGHAKFIAAKARLTPNGHFYYPEVVTKYLETGRLTSKFLPYLVLIRGANYYVNKYSEFNIGKLLDYNLVEGWARLQMLRTGQIEMVYRQSSNEAFFPNHVDELRDLGIGKIYAFTIYPAFLKTVHKLQGTTISERLNAIMRYGVTSYKSVYVIVTRITRPENISHIDIRMMPVTHEDMLRSIIMNVPELTDLPYGEMLDATVIDRMSANFFFYRVAASCASEREEISRAVGRFFMHDCMPDERRQIRDVFNGYAHRGILEMFKTISLRPELPTIATGANLGSNDDLIVHCARSGELIYRLAQPNALGHEDDYQNQQLVFDQCVALWVYLFTNYADTTYRQLQMRYNRESDKNLGTKSRDALNMFVARIDKFVKVTAEKFENTTLRDAAKCILEKFCVENKQEFRWSIDEDFAIDQESFSLIGYSTCFKFIHDAYKFIHSLLIVEKLDEFKGRDRLRTWLIDSLDNYAPKTRKRLRSPTSHHAPVSGLKLKLKKLKRAALKQ